MRVKRGTAHLKRRKNLLARTKGYRWRRKSSIRLARVAALKAGVHAYIDRRKKKGDFRSLWTMKINAAARLHGLSYSQLMALLHRAKVGLNRKMLAHLAEHEPKVFDEIIKLVKRPA